MISNSTNALHIVSTMLEIGSFAKMPINKIVASLLDERKQLDGMWNRYLEKYY